MILTSLPDDILSIIINKTCKEKIIFLTQLQPGYYKRIYYYSPELFSCCKETKRLQKNEEFQKTEKIHYIPIHYPCTIS